MAKGGGDEAYYCKVRVNDHHLQTHHYSLPIRIGKYNIP